MRVRDDFSWLGPALGAGRFAQLRAADLAVARFEPVFRDKRGVGVLDLTFAHAGEAFALCALLVDLVALWTLEAPPLVWPATLAAGLDPDFAEAVEARVYPWLRTLVRGVASPGERLRSYGDEAAFERARAAGWVGAIPCGAAIVAMAPFAYARRFARDAQVSIAARHGALAAALLRDRARAVRLVAGASAPEVAWYGVADLLAPSAAVAAADVAIVDRAAAGLGAATIVALDDVPDGGRTIDVPQPVPLDNGFTFDAADAPVVRTFGVWARPAASRAPAPAVPVARRAQADGLIGFVLRSDAGYAPDADTDELRVLRELLEIEGLRSFVTTDPRDPQLGQADLVHVFAAYDDRHLGAAAESALRGRKPLVISLEPLAAYANWQEDALLIAVQIGLDRVERAFFFENYAERRIIVRGTPLLPDAAQVQQRREEFLVSARAASAVITAACDEPALLGREFGLPPDGLIAGAIALGGEPDGGDVVSALVPPGPFVLMHAPLVRRSHLLLVLTALAPLDIDVVVAGEPADVDTAISLRAGAGREVLFLTEPAPAVLAGLYARAAVYVEPSLRSRSPARLARAVRAGALPLVARDGPLARLVPPELTFSISDPAEIAAAIGGALARPDRVERARMLAAALGGLSDPGRARDAALAAYARAAARSAPAS